ncbi:unnamed protein product [Pleuronectes platessa]|uniref:Uncharacterized protein n=1 Tax=Pleuronectes platessa TaxID=8262 RepID=A0A9N7V763_PLEPL|nr:unnamed protein product [Pleuronectes platessa]
MKRQNGEKLKRRARSAGNLSSELYPQPFTPPSPLTGTQTTFVASLPLRNSNVDKWGLSGSIFPWYYDHNIQTNAQLKALETRTELIIQKDVEFKSVREKEAVRRGFALELEPSSLSPPDSAVAASSASSLSSPPTSPRPPALSTMLVFVKLSSLTFRIPRLALRNLSSISSPLPSPPAQPFFTGGSGGSRRRTTGTRSAEC